MNKGTFSLILLCTIITALCSAPPYEHWKHYKQAQWASLAENTLTSHVADLLGDYHYGKADQQLYAYNFIRSLLGREPAVDWSTVDHDWLSQVEDEAQTYHVMELEGFKPPTAQQAALTKKISELLKIEDDVVAFLCPKDTQAGTGLLQSGRSYAAQYATKNLSYWMYLLFHELGHIHNKDAEKEELIFSGEKTFQETLREPDLQKAIKQIKHYIELGKHAFDSSTALGKQVQQTLDQHKTFWVLPKDPDDYHEILYFRTQESRADLFAFEKLLEQNHLTHILKALDDMAGSDYVVVEGTDDIWPSDFERAMYLTGFLASKGIDVNNALADWYKHGVCEKIKHNPAELFADVAHKKQGSLDFIKAYYRNKD